MGYNYHCVSSVSSRNTDGTGWIPVNLQNLSAGSPVSFLPVDPINQSSSGLYYIYSTDGSRFQIFTALPESTKEKVALTQSPEIAGYPGVIAAGSSNATSPIYNPAGLVAWWPMDEGTGTIAYDRSGNSFNDTLGANVSWQPGKVGTYSITNSTNTAAAGTTNYAAGSALDFTATSHMSVAFWMNTSVVPKALTQFIGCSVGGCWMILYQSGKFALDTWSGPIVALGTMPTDGKWHLVVVAYDGTNAIEYLDGAQVVSAAYTPTWSSGTRVLNVGGAASYSFVGSLDDVRVYNRALSVAEAQGLYNAGD